MAEGKLVKMINSYQDLRNSNKDGNFISVGGSFELVFDPAQNGCSRLPGYNPKHMFTVSIQGEYINQNHYHLHKKDNGDLVRPSEINSFEMGSGVVKEKYLREIALNGGLISDNGYKERSRGD